MIRRPNLPRVCSSGDPIRSAPVTAPSQDNAPLAACEQLSLKTFYHLAVVAQQVELKDELPVDEYNLLVSLFIAEESYITEDLLASEAEFDSIHSELCDSPRLQEELLKSDPSKAGYDLETQEARRQIARAISMSPAAQTAIARKEANLLLFRTTVQGLLRNQTIPRCLSDVVLAATKPLPKPLVAYQCPVLRGNQVDAYNIFIELGFVEKIVRNGRKPAGWIQEAVSPIPGLEDQSGFKHGPWFMKLLGFKVIVWFSGGRVFRHVEICGPGPFVILAIHGAPKLFPFFEISAYARMPFFYLLLAPRPKGQ